MDHYPASDAGSATLAGSWDANGNWHPHSASAEDLEGHIMPVHNSYYAQSYQASRDNAHDHHQGSRDGALPHSYGGEPSYNYAADADNRYDIYPAEQYYNNQQPFSPTVDSDSQLQYPEPYAGSEYLQIPNSPPQVHAFPSYQHPQPQSQFFHVPQQANAAQQFNPTSPQAGFNVQANHPTSVAEGDHHHGAGPGYVLPPDLVLENARPTMAGFDSPYKFGPRHAPTHPQGPIPPLPPNARRPSITLDPEIERQVRRDEVIRRQMEYDRAQEHRRIEEQERVREEYERMVSHHARRPELAIDTAVEAHHHGQAMMSAHSMSAHPPPSSSVPPSSSMPPSTPHTQLEWQGSGNEFSFPHGQQRDDGQGYPQQQQQYPQHASHADEYDFSRPISAHHDAHIFAQAAAQQYHHQHDHQPSQQHYPESEAQHEAFRHSQPATFAFSPSVPYPSSSFPGDDLSQRGYAFPPVSERPQPIHPPMEIAMEPQQIHAHAAVPGSGTVNPMDLSPMRDRFTSMPAGAETYETDAEGELDTEFDELLLEANRPSSSGAARTQRTRASQQAHLNPTASALRPSSSAGRDRDGDRDGASASRKGKAREVDRPSLLPAPIAASSATSASAAAAVREKERGKERKPMPTLACTFCRARKIACGPGFGFGVSVREGTLGYGPILVGGASAGTILNASGSSSGFVASTSGGRKKKKGDENDSSDDEEGLDEEEIKVRKERRVLSKMAMEGATKVAKINEEREKRGLPPGGPAPDSKTIDVSHYLYPAQSAGSSSSSLANALGEPQQPADEEEYYRSAYIYVNASPHTLDFRDGLPPLAPACNQCERRGIVCAWPKESKRGVRRNTKDAIEDENPALPRIQPRTVIQRVSIDSPSPSDARPTTGRQARQSQPLLTREPVAVIQEQRLMPVNIHVSSGPAQGEMLRLDSQMELKVKQSTQPVVPRGRGRPRKHPKPGDGEGSGKGKSRSPKGPKVKGKAKAEPEFDVGGEEDAEGEDDDDPHWGGEERAW